MKPLADEDTQSELLENEKDDKAPETKAGRDYSSIIDKDQLKKKKRIKYGIIGLLILIVVILAIVLPLTLKKGNSPYVPFTYPHYNPYSTKSSVDLQSNVSGVIQAPATYDHDLHIQALNRVIPILKDGTKKLGIDSKGIPKGDNNLFTNNLNF